MQGILERLNSWNQMMLSPGKTAAIYAKRKELSFRDGLENFGMPIIETYTPLLLLTLLISGNFTLLYIAEVLFIIASTTLAVIAASLAFGAMAFLVARYLGAKVEFGRLYYMASLAAAPTFVFTIVTNIAMLLARRMLEAAGVFSFSAGGILQVGGALVAVSVTIYGFYLLTIAIDALCRFGRPKAVATWLAPTAAILAVLALLFSTVFLGIITFLVKTI